MQPPKRIQVLLRCFSCSDSIMGLPLANFPDSDDPEPGRGTTVLPWRTTLQSLSESDESGQPCCCGRVAGSAVLLDARLCGRLVTLTWVLRWYDPWTSLHQVIAKCLGHQYFTFWGCWTPFGHGRAGVCNLIVHLRHHGTTFSQQDIVALSQPHSQDSLFCLERCSALCGSCCIEDVSRPLDEIRLALLQQGSFPVGDYSLFMYLQRELLGLSARGMR